VAFQDADDLESDEDEKRSECGDDVEAGSAGHADGRDHEDGGGAGETEHAVLGVEDEASAEEADALHDVCGDLAAVVWVIAGDDDAHDGEECRAHADEDVGAKAGVLVAPLALKADDSAHAAGHE